MINTNLENIFNSSEIKNALKNIKIPDEKGNRNITDGDITNMLNSSLFKNFVSDPGCSDFFKGDFTTIPNNIKNVMQNDGFKNFINMQTPEISELVNSSINIISTKNNPDNINTNVEEVEEVEEVEVKEEVKENVKEEVVEDVKEAKD